MVELGRVPVRDPGALLPEGFWAAVAVWLERPQVANKRLCGARLEARRSAGGPGPGPGPGAGPAPGPTGGGREHEHGHGHGRGGRRRGEAHAAGPGQTPQAADLEGLWERFSQSLAEDSPEMLAFLTGPGEASRPPAPAPLQLVLRTLIPKACPHRLASPRREIVVQDVSRGTATFLPLGEDSEGNLRVQMSNVYQIQLIHTKGEWFISILIFCPEKWHSDGVIHPNPAWLAEELLPRMARWAVENKKREFKSTLSLISIMNYSRTYQELKEKYKDMVKVWPEVTDPEKFVYEDVAIATYLLVLWEEERAERGLTARQSFVDLGCGNGLLVHILCSEGHPGRGIDVRRRKIWDMYGPQTRLEEGAITPDDKTLFPGVDWLLGNHSDELTPWVPVIAARSSYDCCFFVLPCCFFDFAGKYRRRQSQKTQYREYLDFIREVGLSCGFHVQEDCLRIPSTKRVCLIGKSRTYPASGEAWMDEQRTRYIDGRRCCPVSPPGESLSLAEVARALDREALQRLRRECGGLQTLLRNRHQVFEVLHGRVRIRDWRRELQRPSPAPEAFKTRPCWFFTHHPDGCALPAASCPFAHGPGELRPPRPAGRHRPARGAARGAGSAGHAPGPPRSASCDL